MEQPVVFDNTVLVNFSLVGRPSLIHEAWPHSSCTTAWVLQEYSRRVEEGILPAFKWDRLHPADLEEDEITFAGRLSDSLGRGERSALAVAYHRNGLLRATTRMRVGRRTCTTSRLRERSAYLSASYVVKSSRLTGVTTFSLR